VKLAQVGKPVHLVVVSPVRLPYRPRGEEIVKSFCGTQPKWDKL
jgi:hypothetical protein